MNADSVSLMAYQELEARNAELKEQVKTLDFDNQFLKRANEEVLKQVMSIQLVNAELREMLIKYGARPLNGCCPECGSIPCESDCRLAQLLEGK